MWSASTARAMRSATSADAIAPGAAIPEPQIRLGTPVARSHAARQVPVAASLRHAALDGADHRTSRWDRSGLATPAPGIAVTASARIRGDERGADASAAAATRRVATSVVAPQICIQLLERTWRRPKSTYRGWHLT